GRRDQSAFIAALWYEELCINRRVNKGGGPIIVEGYSPGNILRDSEIAVHSPRRVAIPSRHPGQHRPKRGVAQLANPLDAAARAELLPGVAHRREAVAQVASPSGDDHRLRGAMARADNQVVVIEVELLDGERKKGKVLPIE